MSQSQSQRVNDQIRAREVRLIAPDGAQLGIFPVQEALNIAREQGLDLVEVAPHAKPPVCRIMDYSKWKYEQSKRQKEARKKQKAQDMKEVKMRPAIDQHDFDVKARACRRFLEQGDKVKATIMFRGRELAHVDHVQGQGASPCRLGSKGFGKAFGFSQRDMSSRKGSQDGRQEHDHDPGAQAPGQGQQENRC